MVIVLVITLIEQTENAAELTIQSRHSYIHVFVYLSLARFLIQMTL